MLKNGKKVVARTAIYCILVEKEPQIVRLNALPDGISFMRKQLGFVLLSFGLAACTVSTQPTNIADRAARADVDKAALFGGQEELTKPITLYEAIARAVKYNARQRVDAMEQAIIAGISDSATMDMLPQLAASGGFVTQSKRLKVSAKDADGGESLIVSDKTARDADLQIVYNVLDFGISYVNAKQMSDRRFIAEEARRKSLQRLVHDVRTAFWRTAAAQRVAEDVAAMTSALEQEIVRTGLSGNSVEDLTEQRKLLQALQKLNSLKKEVLTSKAELAALMNLPPGTAFALDIPKAMDAPRVVREFGQIDLEHFALINRPELRIGDYQARIAEREAKKEILRIFPGIEFSAGLNYNSNSYLKSKNWADAGMGVTWNLLGLFSRPQAIRTAKDKQKLERLRREAMTVAVISQVNVSYLQLRQAADAFGAADSLENVTGKLWQKTFAEKTNTAEERRAAVLQAVDVLTTHLERDLAYADYKAAESDLFMALGVDPLPSFSLKTSVASMADMLESNLSRNAPQGFKEVSYDYPPSEHRVRLTALGAAERKKILEWTDLKRTDNVKTDAAALVPVAKAPVQKAVSANRAVKILQMSSFETLPAAQSYWAELNAKNTELAAYAPIYREVEVNGKPRYRTFVAGSEQQLRELCARLAEDLKSCLITVR